jgi:signal transduction histidine kinase
MSGSVSQEPPPGGVPAVARPWSRALAASAPGVLVVLGRPGTGEPAARLPTAAALILAALLLAAAGRASRSPADAIGVGADEAQRVDADPATVAVGRWGTDWPGAACLAATCWWSARTALAGLLLRLVWAFTAGWVTVLRPLPLVVLAVVFARRAWRPALGAAGTAAVALAGSVLAAVGMVAALGGHLHGGILPAGPWWPGAGSRMSGLSAAASATLLLTLGTTGLLALVPLWRTRKPAAPWSWRQVTGVSTVVAVATWAVALPVLLRAARSGQVIRGGVPSGNSSADVLLAGAARLLAPVLGPDALMVARCLLVGASLAAVAGALAAGSRLALVLSQHQRDAKAASGPDRARAAGITLVGAAAVAALGPQPWLLSAVAATSGTALMLTALAPERAARRVPALSVVATVTWLVVTTSALAWAGTAAILASVGVALTGPLLLAWHRNRRDPDPAARPSLLTTTSFLAAVLGVASVGSLLAFASAVDTMSATLALRAAAAIVAGVGVVAVVVVPATIRIRAQRLSVAADTLAHRMLPALVESLEAVGDGHGPKTPALVDVAETREGACAHAAPGAGSGAPSAANSARPSEENNSDELAALADALDLAVSQVGHLAAGIDRVSLADAQRVEEIVQERTAAFVAANRNLQDSQRQRRQLLDRTVRAAEDERTRLAANLHDGPIQRLAALGILLDRCRLRLDRPDPEAARELMIRARAELAAEIVRLRQMMSELRPPVLDEGGLDAALRDHLADWSLKTAVECRLDISPHVPLSRDAETVIYRVVQEALANVAKHAYAANVAVTVSMSGDGILVAVQDDGRGFDVTGNPDLLRTGHFGLVVMRERVELADGRFEVRSAMRTGTKVLAWLPTSAESAERPAPPFPIIVEPVEAA